MFSLVRWLVQSVVKFAIGIAAGGGVSLLALGGLALLDGERWDVRVLENYGPPIGPLLLSIGAGLATTGGTLYSLFFSTPTPVADDRGLALHAAAPARIRMS